MNYLAIRNEVLTRFSAGRDDAHVKLWVQAAYKNVWEAFDWSFKQVDQTALTVAAGNRTPTVPTDFGSSLDVYDDYGNALAALDPRDFDRAYQAAKVEGDTGRPEAYKVVNRQIVLGPVPDAGYAFSHTYKRRLVSLLTDSVTVQVGGFALDTDKPYWTPDVDAWHMILVLGALKIGQALESDLAASLTDDLHQAELASMIEEFGFADVGAENREYGADAL